MFTVFPANFTWRQSSVLAIRRLVEPIAFCSIMAYAFLIVQNIKGTKNASFFAGLLVAAFAAAEACTAWIWGDISANMDGNQLYDLLWLARRYQA